jgi:hypothetical protein
MAWNADIRCSGPPWQCVSAYSCSYSNIAGAFQMGVVGHPPHSPDLTPSNYQVGSQHFNNNDSWWKVLKRGWAHRWQTSLTQEYKNLFSNMTYASVPEVTTLRSAWIMLYFLYIIILFSLCLFCLQLTTGQFPNSPHMYMNKKFGQKLPYYFWWETYIIKFIATTTFITNWQAFDALQLLQNCFLLLKHKFCLT